MKRWRRTDLRAVPSQADEPAEESDLERFEPGELSPIGRRKIYFRHHRSGRLFQIAATKERAVAWSPEQELYFEPAAADVLTLQA